MLSSLLTLLLSAGGLALFSYSFPPWKVSLYGVSAAILILAAGLFGALCGKNGGKKKLLLSVAVTAAVFAAVFFGLTFLINNVIFEAHESTKAALIVVGIMTVFFAVCFLLALKAHGKKPFPAALAILLGALIAYSPFLPSLIRDAKVRNVKPQAAPTGTSVFTEKEREKLMDADFYVSPAGDDNNSGSFDKPFATVEKARDAVRALDKTGKDEVTVAVMAGEYRTDSLLFTEEDSGTELCPIAYRAFGDGEVILNGGITIAPGDFGKPEDADMLSRLNEDAKEHVLCADLTGYGLTAKDWGKIYAIGSYNTAAKYDGDYVGGIYCELFVNDKRQTLARYPDTGYLYTEKVLETGYGRESDGALTAVENWDEVRNPAPDVYRINRELADRIASWKTLDDVWMFGFWKYDWADASSPIGEFSAESCILSPKFVSTYGTKTDAPYYFFNVFEELTAPGEWYLDRDNGVVYVYPDGDLGEAVIDMSITENPIIRVDGASHITFDGFTVKGTRGNAIVISGDGVVVENCLIKNVAGWAVTADGSDCAIISNEITRTGQGGITLNGGDRETLTPGMNRAENNLIHDWSEIYQTYQAAVSLGGTGNICAHNEMYNSPHEAITYGGNDHVIEYNLIHDVCLLTDDGGAIYAGRRWDFYGNVIRYNCIYDLGADGHRPCGIYLDDALSGQTVYGNLLVNVPSIALHLGGGRDLTVTNNIVINTNDASISYDARAIEGVFGGWFTHSSQEGGDMWQNLFNSPWQTETWKNAYPEMQRFSNDFDNTDNPDFVPNPAYSDVSHNIIVNLMGDIGSISDAAANYSTIENNSIFKLSEIETLFSDPANGDYTLKTPIEGFEDIPLAEIGRY